LCEYETAAELVTRACDRCDSFADADFSSPRAEKALYTTPRNPYFP
jgi:hypothetical protein